MTLILPLYGNLRYGVTDLCRFVLTVSGAHPVRASVSVEDHIHVSQNRLHNKSMLRTLEPV